MSGNDYFVIKPHLTHRTVGSLGQNKDVIAVGHQRMIVVHGVDLAETGKIDPVDNDHPLVTDGEYRIVMPSSSDKTKTVSEVRLYDEIIVSGQNLYDGKLL